MIADLPAYWTETGFSLSDLGAIKERAESLKPLYYIVRDTWTHETLADIAKGKVFISDEMLNSAVSERLSSDGNSPLSEIKLKCGDNRLDIFTRAKDGERLELSGRLTEFVHRGDSSYMTYKIDKHKWPGHGIYSWLFANLSLSVVQSLMGDLQLPENFPLTFKGSTLTVDFSDIVNKSAFGKARVGPIYLKDAVVIENAVLKEGGIELRTRLDMPDEYKRLLQEITERVQKQLGR